MQPQPKSDAKFVMSKKTTETAHQNFIISYLTFILYLPNNRRVIYYLVKPNSNIEKFYNISYFCSLCILDFI